MLVAPQAAQLVYALPQQTGLQRDACSCVVVSNHQQSLSSCVHVCLPAAACQVDREEREWCAGLPTHVFAPWVERLVAQDAPGITAPPLPVR
jgi:hypothetical protein